MIQFLNHSFNLLKPAWTGLNLWIVGRIESNLNLPITTNLRRRLWKELRRKFSLWRRWLLMVIFRVPSWSKDKKQHKCPLSCSISTDSTTTASKKSIRALISTRKISPGTKTGNTINSKLKVASSAPNLKPCAEASSRRKTARTATLESSATSSKSQKQKKLRNWTASGRAD